MRILFFGITALLAGMMAALPFYMEHEMLYVFEGVLLMAVAGMIALYRSVIGPTRTLERGIDLLKAQDFASRLVHVGYGPADKIADTFNAMINQLKYERLRIREQNQFLDRLAEASPMGILTFDFDKRIHSANPAAIRLLGGIDPTGKLLAETDSELAQALAKLPAKTTKVIRTGDNSMMRCSNLYFFDRGHEKQFILIESLTKELLEAERSAYEKVIRTIVHQVNNTLAGVLPLIDTFAMISGDESLETVAKSCAERCNSLSAFIGNFANVVKIGAPQLKKVNINDFLMTIRPFLESLASGKDINIVFDMATDMPDFAIDTVQFEQVIVNIVKNAVESIGDGSGAVEISTQTYPPEITITDNGKGISEEAADKLFSPFFSTKKGGQGIGLTLSAEILRAHNFKFRLSTSRADNLTRFVIYLNKPMI